MNRQFLPFVLSGVHVSIDWTEPLSEHDRMLLALSYAITYVGADTAYIISRMIARSTINVL